MRLFKPTLTRRLLVALCASFLLVWGTLLTYTYFAARNQERTNNPALSEAAQQILEQVSDSDAPEQAMRTIATIDRVTNSARHRLAIPGTVGMQLWDEGTGQRLYSSPAIAGIELPSSSSSQSSVRVGGGKFFAVSRKSGRWSVRVAQQEIERGWLLRGLGTDLLRYLLIAFPLVVVPAWIAVRLGLRPLNRLSAIIRRRSANDLSPIQYEEKYEELRPVVGAIEGLLSRLNAAIARERSFLHDAAHELRTPLAAIALHAYDIRRGSSSAEIEEATGKLQRAVDRSARTTQQLLDLARLDNPQPMQVSELDLAERIRGMLAEMVPAAKTRGMDLSFQGPERLLVRVDIAPVDSIVSNLVDNAIRYGSEGGAIIVTLARESDTWTLSVADDGPGIPAAHQARMFERFARGAQDVPGSGLGLAIVRQAAHHLRADLRVTEGLNGRGITFFVTVPRLAAA